MRPAGPLPDAKCTHLVITRFSVRFVAGESPFPRRWLDDRLRLLEAYCLPGLEAQTSTRFRWLLLCDETTDPDCLAELAETTRDVPGSTVVLTSVGGSSLPDVLGHVVPAADVLVTTRLDSDDAVAVDFVERIQRYVASFRASDRETLLVNFCQGRTFDVKAKAMYDSFQPNGPYLSLFERVGVGRGPRTVYSGNHGRLYLEHPLHLDGSRAAWLQVLHGQNVSNHVRKVDLPATALSAGDQFVIRPWAARRVSGEPAPHARQIKSNGERGTEGLLALPSDQGELGNTG